MLEGELDAGELDARLGYEKNQHAPLRFTPTLQEPSFDSHPRPHRLHVGLRTASQKSLRNQS